MYKKINKPSISSYSKISSESSTENISDNEDLNNEDQLDANIFNFSESFIAENLADQDARRIDHLKLAINKGKYTINPLRVAEKFIQFESQMQA